MSKSGITVYPNDRPKLGLVDVISNVDKDNPGSQQDVTDITHAFRWVGLEVKKPYFDLQKTEMMSTINEVLNPSRSISDYNLYVLVIICDIEDGTYLLSSDGEKCFSVAEIIYKLGTLEALQGRPKLLILETCSGKYVSPGFQLTISVRKNTFPGTLPFFPDLLVAYSTVSKEQGSVEYDQGHSFLTVLGDKLKTLAESEHLADILTFVNYEMRDNDSDGLGLISEWTSTLGKKVFLVKEDNFCMETVLEGDMKARTFGDPDAIGQVVFENGHFFSGLLRNGQISFQGSSYYEWPSGNVRELDFEPSSKDWENFSGKGVSYNIREKWRYVGRFKNGKAHGSGIYYFEDGQIYIGNYEQGFPTGYGCMLPTDFQEEGGCDIMILLND